MSTIAHPPLPPLTPSKHGGWEGFDGNSFWDEYRDRTGPYGGRGSGLRPGRYRVNVALPASAASAFPEQARAYGLLSSYPRGVGVVVTRAILSRLPSIRSSWDEDFMGQMPFPVPVDSLDLRAHIGLTAIHVSCLGIDGYAVIGLELGCTWDEEHGLGVLIAGDRVLEVGQADTAFLEWVAEAHGASGLV